MRALLIALLSLPAVSLVACAGEPPPATSQEVGGIRMVNASQLKQELDGGKVRLLVDVRTPEEFASGHAPGAKNIPLDQLESRLAELDAYKDGEIHVICQSGRRSLAASQTLAGKGYDPVNVEGGTAGWKAAGYAVE